MLRVAFIDDEPQMCERLLGYAERYERENGVQFIKEAYGDGFDVLALNEFPDILFLDIEMKNLDGMKTAEEIRKRDDGCVIVFFTHMAQYAVEGYGVRAAEYFSEDAIVSYYAGNNVIKAMSDKGLAGNFKHFFLNEQENGRQGISTFSNEQAMREIYLRAFEGGITDGALAIMTSYNRLGCVSIAQDPVTLNALLRDEWGFCGYTITDYIQQGEYSSTLDTVINGTDMFGGSDRGTEIQQFVLRNRSTSGEVVERLQESAKRILWSLSNTNMMNGLTSDAVLSDTMYWWQAAILGIQIGAGVLTAASAVMYVFMQYFKKEKVAV